MDLQALQYRMWLAVKKHQVLVGRRQQEPHNVSIQKEILDVLCQLVSINESQKLVVARLREERESERVKQEGDEGKCKEEVDLLCEEEMLQDDRAIPYQSPSHNPYPAPATPPHPGHTTLDHCFQASGDGSEGGAGDGGSVDELGNPAEWWCSPEKRIHSFHPPMADYSQEDIHDLVTEEEFMHAVGLLTVPEWEEVLGKRHERRKHTAYSHVFSATIWEKPETRRKRRAWLTSGAGSPPTLRRKVRPPSQPPSRPPSRPASPGQSSCSPVTTLTPFSQPPSPQSLEEDEPTPSQEICPMCKVKGADVQCDGCGVVYHGGCVDLGDSEPPQAWLCLTCEQLGLRASSHSDPQYYSRRREAMVVRERLLRQRAELTISKLQLEERKSLLARTLESQCWERTRLQQKEEEVRRAIHQLHTFIYTFQKPQHQHQSCTSPPSQSTSPHQLPTSSPPQSTSPPQFVSTSWDGSMEAASSMCPDPSASPRASPSSSTEASVCLAPLSTSSSPLPPVSPSPPPPPPTQALSPPQVASGMSPSRWPSACVYPGHKSSPGHTAPVHNLKHTPTTHTSSPTYSLSPIYPPSPTCPPTYTSTYTCSSTPTSKSSTSTSSLRHQSNPTAPRALVSSSVSRNLRPAGQPSPHYLPDITITPHTYRPYVSISSSSLRHRTTSSHSLKNGDQSPESATDLTIGRHREEDSEAETSIQPTDLSTTAFGAQGGMSSIRRGEREIMAAFL